MVRFLTNPLNFAIMGVHPAFDFGDFNVTPIVYQHLLLEHRSRKNHPNMLGPILVHHDKKFSSYHYFASTLISLKASLRNIIALVPMEKKSFLKLFSLNFLIHLTKST